MDFDSFRNLVHLFFTGTDEQRNEAEIVLNNIAESNFPFVLEYLNQIIFQYDQIFKLRAATILFSYVRHSAIIYTPEIISAFWNNFSSLFSIILIDPQSSERLKQTITHIISEILTYSINKLETNQILNSLISIFNQNLTILPYIITCLSDSLYGIENFSYFSIEDLLSLVQSDCSQLDRFNLLLSITIHAPDNEFINQNFMTILTSLEIIHLPRVFQLLSDFVERVPMFFEPHLEQFGGFLINIIQNGQNECRIQAILFTNEFCKYCSEFIKSNFEFTNNLILSLIITMSEIDDSPEWLEDINDRNPYAIAYDIFNDVTMKLNSKELLETIIQFFNKQITELSNWKLVYASLIAISCTSSYTLSNLIEDEDNTASREILIDLMQPVSSMLEQTDVHPRIRYASYQVINNFCTSMPSLFSLALFDTLFPILLEKIPFEENLLVKKAAIDSLSSFIKNTSMETLTTMYPSMLETLLGYITQCSDTESCVKLLFCLGLFIMGIGEFFDRLDDVANVLAQLFESTEDDVLKFNTVITFAMCLNKAKLTEQTLQMASDFLEILMNIRNDLFESEDMEKCHIATILLIQALGNNINDIEKLFESFLETANSEISFVVLHHYDTGIDVSCMKRIPSPQKGAKLFINEVQTVDVARALKTLSVLVKSVDEIPLNFLQECALSAANKLSRDIFIEILAEHAISLLMQVFRSSGENNEFKRQILSTVIETFITLHSSVILTPSYVNTIVINVSEMMHHAKEISWGNEESATILLKSTMMITERLFDALQKIVIKKKGDNSTEIEIDLPISMFQMCLANIPQLYHEILLYDRQNSINFFESELEQKIAAMFNDALMAKTAIEIWFTFVNNMTDLNRLSNIFDFLVQCINSNDFDLKQSIFICLHNSFKIIKVDQPIFDKFYNLFVELINGESLMTNATVSDCALGAFCSLVTSNHEFTNSKIDSHILLMNLPIESIEDISETVYSLFVHTVSKFPQWFFSEENFETVISHLIQAFECSSVSQQTKFNVLIIFKKIMQSNRAAWLKKLYEEMTPLQQKVIRMILSSISKPK